MAFVGIWIAYTDDPEGIFFTAKLRYNDIHNFLFSTLLQNCSDIHNQGTFLKIQPSNHGHV